MQNVNFVKIRKTESVPPLPHLATPSESIDWFHSFSLVQSSTSRIFQRPGYNAQHGGRSLGPSLLKQKEENLKISASVPGDRNTELKKERIICYQTSVLDWNGSNMCSSSRDFIIARTPNRISETGKNN